MIEVIPNVYYDPAKEWYEQEQSLIELALQVEQTEPISYEFEHNADASHVRPQSLTWHHRTDLGLFEMIVTLHYLYKIEANNFKAKARHNSVNITKIEDE